MTKHPESATVCLRDRPALSTELVEDVLYEIRLWDQGRGCSPEELVNKLRLLFTQSPQSR